MFETPSPTDREELFTALKEQGEEIHDALAELPVGAFLAPQGEHWSPADHLRHLTKSVRPLGKVLGWPKILPGIRFGLHFGPTRSFEEIVELYRAALAAGGQAGRYGPRPRGEGELSDGQWRQRSLEQWKAACRSLQEVLPRWQDGALDRYQLPHPLMGKFTVREMLYFTYYHNAHHARRVFERLPQAKAV